MELKDEYIYEVRLVDAKNPLHGVERAAIAPTSLVPVSRRIHYMELKVPPYRWLGNRRAPGCRIHYMELKGRLRGWAKGNG